MTRSRRVNPYDLLLEAIEAGEIAPGDRLRESDLAARFGISRTPVREALGRLEAQGVVASNPREGLVVAQLGYQQIVQLYYLREILEGATARLAAQHATSPEVAALKDMLRDDAAIDHDPSELARRNRIFHDYLHTMSRNRYLIDSLAKMRTSLVLLAGTTLAAPLRGPNSLREHEELVDAIAARDGDAAEAAARAHIRNAFKVRLAQRLTTLERQPNSA